MKKNNTISLIIPWVAAIFSLVFIAGLLLSPTFSIQEIRCIHAAYPKCPEELQAELERYRGNTIWFFQRDILLKKLHRSLPKAERIKVDTQFPRTLSVRVSPETEFIYLKVATNSANLIANLEGRIVDQTVTDDLPYPEIISSSVSQLSANEEVNQPEIRFALNLIKTLDQTYITPQKIIIHDPTTIQLYFSNGIQALTSSKADFTRQVNSLQLILNKDTMLSDDPRIDVRFKQPVIKPSF